MTQYIVVYLVEVSFLISDKKKRKEKRGKFKRDGKGRVWEIMEGLGQNKPSKLDRRKTEEKRHAPKE